MKEDPENDKDKDARIWGALLFGLIGATFTTFAVILFLQFVFLNRS